MKLIRQLRVLTLQVIISLFFLNTQISFAQNLNKWNEGPYVGISLVFNSIDAEIHLFSLNYFNESDLNETLEDLKGKKMMFYYQNQNYHKTNEQKENELQSQLNKYLKIISGHTGYSWWTYIRHFIIRN